ncbi:hypothetical protein bpr_IV057 (plasmid) [Butyrivibrio proteoclasticus B316]|uniref:Uncharacterized protein n=1 Tax=Butyrivibrio proteoclasticus (strain ATCC 51982 / DSM 14932 / B316) TaxID=515622 RepID=E0S4U0_BUTPB|nr:hypothetical protein [Butyrivibrio proteoclasticus]ADL36422.1 hypothetical protein bpr_IV057 [Butyrivibrio proteoclasticus B316]
MGSITEFSIGCRRCANLEQIGKKSFMCSVRSHMDDSDVVPIRDGKKTEDWCICDGEYYRR